MKLEIKWNIYLVVIFGLIDGFVESLPLDMDSIKDGIQMGVLTGAGMAMDLAEKVKFQGKVDDEVSIGEFKMRRKFGAGGGVMGNSDDSSSSEERRRRRRSANNNEEIQLTEVVRSKRSPCFGRRRQTTAAPAGGAGGAGGGAAGGGGAGGANGAGGAGDAEDLPRRRKRSRDELDSNENIIPYQKTFSERTQEIGERIRQMMKNMLDALAGAFENMKRSIENGMGNNSTDMQ